MVCRGAYLGVYSPAVLVQKKNLRYRLRSLIVDWFMRFRDDERQGPIVVLTKLKPCITNNLQKCAIGLLHSRDW